jgi:3-deoxy-7-phosphoheptulonate synthase
MIVIMQQGATDRQIDHVIERIGKLGLTPHVSRGEFRTVIGAIGDKSPSQQQVLESLAGVERVVPILKPFKLASREFHAADTVVTVGGVPIGGGAIVVIAGPCAVESAGMVRRIAAAVAGAGAVMLRGGAFKPRTSPYDFQGLGRDCLPWVFDIAARHGIKVIAMEVTNARHIDEIHGALDRNGRATGVMLQVGTRNAQNFELLRQVGQQRELPVLFKRGMGITLEESLLACEYVASEGNPNIVFCLRGVKTHLGDPHRNMVDFAHVPVVRRQTRMPVCIDPSHSVGTMRAAPDGLSDIVHVTGQGIIAGASMVLVDVHPVPEKALCDGPQALRLEQVPRFVEYVRRVRACYDEVTRGPLE